MQIKPMQNVSDAFKQVAKVIGDIFLSPLAATGEVIYSEKNLYPRDKNGIEEARSASELGSNIAGVNLVKLAYAVRQRDGNFAVGQESYEEYLSKNGEVMDTSRPMFIRLAQSLSEKTALDFLRKFSEGAKVEGLLSSMPREKLTEQGRQMILPVISTSFLGQGQALSRS